MIHHYSCFVLCLLFEWSSAQSGLFRINTAQDTSAFMHSFKPPLADKLYFWEPGADAVITPAFVQLTPATQGSTGFIWNKKKANMKDWEAVFEFKLAGRKDMGGDGFAFWYTDQVGMVGPVYGSSDFWTGLAIFFDTYDNDREMATPLISVSLNDGTQSYDPERDGATDALGTCSFKIRNTPEKVSAKIRHMNGVLSVQISMARDVLGLPIYSHCVEVKNVHIAPEGYFGFSSHTGDLADSHHIYSMTVKDFSPIHTNLNDLKRQWEQEQETLHQQHNDLTESDFKHNVLAQLRQTQEEVNMIEMSTLADAKEIKKGLEMVSLLEVLLKNLFSQFSAKMSDDDVSVADGSWDKIGMDSVASQNIENDFQKIRSLIEILKTSSQGGDKDQNGQVAEIASQIDSIKREMSFFYHNFGQC